LTEGEVKRVTVRIDENYCQVEGFPKHSYRIPERLLEKFESGEISQKELQHLGHHIFLALFPDEDRQRKILPSEGERVLIVIESELSKVHNIPFELICQNVGLPPEVGFLLKNPNVSLIRSVPAVRVDRPTLRRPLKVLFVLSQPLKIMEESPIDPLREVRRVKEALKEYIDRGWVELKIEVKASLQHLRNRLKEGYDIVHFSGHGGKGGFLYLESDEEPENYHGAGPEEIATIFRESPLPYLIYIDACETSKSGTFLPSLTFKLHRELGGVAVVGNISEITDRGATESVKTFYSRLFEGYPHLMVSALRTKAGYPEWYKTVCFAVPNLRLFEEPEEAREEKSVKHFRRISESNRYYVYRYDLVRRTADAVERDNHLFLHGIAGMGKSTLAEYLCEFFESEFENVIFVDFEDEEIETPQELMDYLADFFEFEKDENPVKALDNLRKKLGKERLFLVLDNVDYSVQEENGKVKKEWKRFLTELLRSNNIFTVFTSRLKLFLSKRSPLTNAITVSEFMEADLHLLSQWLSKEEKNLLFSGREKLREELGLYPYAISIWLENKLPVESVKRVVKEKLRSEKGDAVAFYGSYFKSYPELNLLVTLPYPPSKLFVSTEYPHLIEVISRLALAEDRGDSYRFHRALTLFVDEELKEKELENFLRKISNFKEKSLYDYLNWLYLSPQKLIPLMELLSEYGFEGAHYVSVDVIKEAQKRLGVLKISEPDYAMTLNNLANLLKSKGENGEAEKLFREAFEVYSNALRKKVAFSDKKWLEYLGSWLYSRLILGVNGNREFFKRLCSLLAHERVIEPERDFFHFLVSELRSSPEREKIVADLKNSFEKVSSFLTPVCRKTLSDFIDRLEEALRSKEDKL